jgi:hypothetical protein
MTILHRFFYTNPRINLRLRWLRRGRDVVTGGINGRYKYEYELSGRKDLRSSHSSFQIMVSQSKCNQ